MAWLITGASGQLGLAMCEKLASNSIPFIAVNSKELDITQEVSVKDFLRKHLPRVVVNCAAWTDVDGAEINKDQAYRVNAEGPRNLAAASRIHDAKLVHISTDYVFSGENNGPWSENNQTNPISTYGLTKRGGENFIQDIYADGSYIVRTAWLYSEFGKNFVKTMLKLALADDAEVKVVNDQIGQPTSAKDLSQQVIDMVLKKSPCGIYHGTNSGEATWYEFARKIFELLGQDVARVIPVTSNAFPRFAKRPEYSVLGHDNWFEIGLPEMRDWRMALTDEIPKILLASKRNHQR